MAEFAYDLSGNGNHAQLQGGVGRTDQIVAGASGFALGDLDKQNDYASLPDLGFLGDVEVTISLWAYLTDDHFPDNFPALIALNNTPGPAGSFLALTIRLNRPAIDFGTFRRAANFSISQDDWHHIAVTKSPGNITSTAKVYVDGVDVSATTFGGETVSVAADNGSAAIGRLTSTGAYVQGRIDEIKVLNRALIADEITWLYNSFRGLPGGTDPTSANLVAHWSFDDTFIVIGDDRPSVGAAFTNLGPGSAYSGVGAGAAFTNTGKGYARGK